MTTSSNPSSLIDSVSPRSLAMNSMSRDSASLSHVKPLSPVALVGLASPHRIATRRERDLRHPAPLCRHRSGDVGEAYAQSVRVRDRSIRCQVVVNGDALKMFVQVDYRCGCFRIVCGSGQRITSAPTLPRWLHLSLYRRRADCYYRRR